MSDKKVYRVEVTLTRALSGRDGVALEAHAIELTRLPHYNATVLTGTVTQAGDPGTAAILFGDLVRSVIGGPLQDTDLRVQLVEPPSGTAIGKKERT